MYSVYNKICQIHNTIKECRIPNTHSIPTYNNIQVEMGAAYAEANYYLAWAIKLTSQFYFQ